MFWKFREQVIHRNVPLSPGAVCFISWFPEKGRGGFLSLKKTTALVIGSLTEQCIALGY